jgi:hypothetical protein
MFKIILNFKKILIQVGFKLKINLNQSTPYY